MSGVEPDGVVTFTFTVPAACAGATAVMVVLESTLKLAASTPSKVTAEASLKSVPLMMTDPPPSVEPETGVSPVMAGGP